MTDAIDYNFEGLSDEQGWLILSEGWRIGQKHPDGSDWVQPTPKQVKLLIERGLMTAHEKQVGMLKVTEYRVGLDVHAAYCFSCDDGEDDDD